MFNEIIIFCLSIGILNADRGPERNIARIHLHKIDASSGCGNRKQSCELLVDGNNTKGEYLVTNDVKMGGVRLVLKEKFIISRVFVYPRTEDDHVNLGEIEVRVGSGTGSKNYYQCGNTIRSGLQMPDKTPVLFQCNSVVGYRGDTIKILRKPKNNRKENDTSPLSIYEIEVYAHENDLNVIMAEGDFGDRRMNHLLLGPYKRVLEPVRNVAARPVYQKWDQPHIYLTYYSKSESWHVKKNDTLGKASALAVMRRTDEYSNYCWTPLDYLGDDGESGKCMVYKHIRGMNALAWDKCTIPIVFKPAQIHQYIKIENGFSSSLSLKTILNGEYRFVPDTAKLFTKSGGRPVYQNVRWGAYYLHYVESEENWFFTEVHQRGDQFEQYPSAFVNFGIQSLTPDRYEVTRCVLIETHGGNRFCGGDIKLTGSGRIISHFDHNF